MVVNKQYKRQDSVYNSLRVGLLNIRTAYNIRDTKFYVNNIMLQTPYFYYKFGDELKNGTITALPFAFFCTIDNPLHSYGMPVIDIFNMKDNVHFSPQYFIDKDFIKLSEIESKFKISLPYMTRNVDGSFEIPYAGDPFYDDEDIFGDVDTVLSIGGKDTNTMECVGYGWFIPMELADKRLLNKFKQFISRISFTVEKQRIGYDSFSYFVKFFE